MPCFEEKKTWLDALEGLKGLPKPPRLVGSHPEARIAINGLKTIELFSKSFVAEAKESYDSCMAPYIREKVRTETLEYFIKEEEKKK
jgi:hypothetical protein